MKFVKSLAKYFTGLGGGLFGLSIFALVSAGQMWASYEDYQKEVNKEMNDAMVMAGQIIMIVSSIMFGLAFIFLITYIMVRKRKHVKIESEPVREKSCPSCGTDITFLAICPKCGFVVKTK